MYISTLYGDISCVWASNRDRIKPITVTSRVVAREFRVRDRKKKYIMDRWCFIVAKFVAFPFVHSCVRSRHRKKVNGKRTARLPFSGAADKLICRTEYVVSQRILEPEVNRSI